MVMKRKNPNLQNDEKYFFSVAVMEILLYAFKGGPDELNKPK